MAIPDIRVIDPRDFMVAEGAGALSKRCRDAGRRVSAASSMASPVADRSIKAMLFADVVKFSKLRADQIPDLRRSISWEPSEN